MQMLSDDDVNLRDMTPEELDAAWDLWFDLAQATNESDPAYEHGVFVGVGHTNGHREPAEPGCATPSARQAPARR